MPHQIFLVLIETDRVNGAFAKEPFKFENAKVEKVKWTAHHGGESQYKL